MDYNFASLERKEECCLLFSYLLLTMSSPRNKPAKPPAWKDLPSFLDASASVAVATFGARRLPEIKDMWVASLTKGVDDDGDETRKKAHIIPSVSLQALRSGGGKKSSRHLRRRATSHKSRKRHRAPQHATGGKKQQQSCSLQKTSTRRTRRSHRGTLRLPHELSWQRPACTTTTIVDEPAPKTTHWMSTHLWHAKRFHMERLWDWQVPMMHSNRGAQAALRLCREKCVVHDATWCRQPLWFGCGSAANTQLALQRVIPDFMRSSSLQKDKEVPAIVCGEGMMHQVDRFPMGAIAPVTWMVSSKPWGESQNKGEQSAQAHDVSYVYLMVHPSALDEATAALTTVLTESGAGKPSLFVNGGLACLQLRGLQSETCLKLAIGNSLPFANTNRLTSYLQAEAKPHLSVLELEEDKKPNEQDSTCCFLRIVRQSPRDQHLPQNVGVTGYDIYCSAPVARDLFLCLNNWQGCCPIGWTEHAHLCLEAAIPVFPRDFPDTKQGRLYWSSDSSWSTVRTYLVGGTGSIQRTAKSHDTINWNEYVKNDNDTKSRVAVVRGSFGDPFRNALVGMVAPLATPSSTDTALSTRRKRRRVEHHPIIKAPCLGKESTIRARRSCLTMFESLSLPTLLVCHITIMGKGRLLVGDQVRSLQNEELGVVTKGCFSISRGAYHGMGVIGGSRFLQAVARTDRTCPAFVAQAQDGTKQVQLGVRIVDKHGKRNACRGTVSLIL